METTFIHELERILQVDAPREVKADFGYLPSASDIFKSDGFDILLNNKRFHFKPVANPDVEEALKTYHGILAESIQPRLAYELSNTTSLNTTSRLYWKKRAAELGHVEAQCDLGNCYYGGKDVAQDYIEAVKWYRMAAEQGNVKAQDGLGECYYYGFGISKDYSEAVKWYRKAAEQGYASAQKTLGDMYYDGEGVPQDYVEAVKWYRKAAEQGNSSGQNKGTLLDKTI